MTVEQKFAVTAARGTSVRPEQFSAAWWEARSPEELRDIIKRGFAGGDAFQGAVAEAERRAREATTRLRDAAAVAAAKRKKLLKTMTTIGLSTVAVIALILGAWFGF
jgi:hypothetical protein